MIPFVFSSDLWDDFMDWIKDTVNNFKKNSDYLQS